MRRAGAEQRGVTPAWGYTLGQLSSRVVPTPWRAAGMVSAHQRYEKLLNILIMRVVSHRIMLGCDFRMHGKQKETYVRVQLGVLEQACYMQNTYQARK